MYYGEESRAEYAASAISDLHVRRVDHGIRAVDDSALDIESSFVDDVDQFGSAVAGSLISYWARNYLERKGGLAPRCVRANSSY